MCYVLMLDLHDRISEALLFVTLLFLILPFSLGTTLFVAGDDPTPRASIVIFVHVLSQFFFRVLAVCLLCVKFEIWAVPVIALSWLAVFLFGPHETFSFWITLLKCGSTDRGQSLRKILQRFLLTSLSFFMIMKPAFSASTATTTTSTPTATSTPTTTTAPRTIKHAKPKSVYIPALVEHNFRDTGFVWFRLFENAGMVLSFFVVQQRNEREYEGWMHEPLLVLGGAVSCWMLTALTWAWISLGPIHNHNSNSNNNKCANNRNQTFKKWRDDARRNDCWGRSRSRFKIRYCALGQN
eukprot:c12389_g1_i2.p2 GENE.c12389_g1_i2~~c12389_g1_i2.p2  ORF type:complete len:296 (-),score=74.90 c12389_g1_i2:892-1779(-)